MRGVGFEPTQIALTDLKTVALTTRPSSLWGQDSLKQLRSVFGIAGGILRKVLLGFEPRFWESKSHVLTKLDYSTAVIFLQLTLHSIFGKCIQKSIVTRAITMF
jgi:hypothetical protein